MRYVDSPLQASSEGLPNARTPYGSNGSGVENGNGWLFDVWLREENGQQLERTTLEMVLSDELLAFPLGIFLRDLDVTAPSGTCTPSLLLASSTLDSAHTTIRVCTHMA